MFVYYKVESARGDEKMLNINVPIEMIASCNTLGEMQPIKFRVEDDAHQMLTLKVDEVVYKKESIYAGIKTFEYGCKIRMEDKEQLIEVRYHVINHKWTIKKIVC